MPTDTDESINPPGLFSRCFFYPLLNLRFCRSDNVLCDDWDTFALVPDVILDCRQYAWDLLQPFFVEFQFVQRCVMRSLVISRSFCRKGRRLIDVQPLREFSVPLRHYPDFLRRYVAPDVGHTRLYPHIVLKVIYICCSIYHAWY